MAGQTHDNSETSPLTASSPLSVSYDDDGVHVFGSHLWLDSESPRPLCFVSTGHNRRQIRHARVLGTPPTIRFLRRRIGDANALITPYNRPFNIGGLRLELLPAGSMLGAAQIAVERNGDRLIYTGWLGPLDGLETAHSPQIRECATLVLYTHALMPRTAGERIDGQRKLVAAIAESVINGQTPVILCEPVGAAQEIAAWCRRLRLNVRGHRSVAAFAADYRRFGREASCPELRLWSESDHELDADVVIYPMLLAHSPVLERIPNRRMITVDPACHHPDAEVITGVSCHASLEELVTYARLTKPDEIVVLGSLAESLARSLRAQEIAPVTVLRPPRQRRLF